MANYELQKTKQSKECGRLDKLPGEHLQHA